MHALCITSNPLTFEGSVCLLYLSPRNTRGRAYFKVSKAEVLDKVETSQEALEKAQKAIALRTQHPTGFGFSLATPLQGLIRN